METGFALNGIIGLEKQEDAAFGRKGHGHVVRIFNWSYAAPDNPSIQNDNAVITGSPYSDAYMVTAKGNGIRRITASGPDGSGAENLTCDVKAMDYKRQLILIADPPRAAVGETIHLRALVYTTQNGITTGGTDVTDNHTCIPGCVP